MGNSHIDDCYTIALAALENRQLEHIAEAEIVIESDDPTKAN
ncbi:hypothetical protein [Vreelandella lionensis]|nr:hypothetical protein [Halomonas lionensis]